MSFDLDGLTEAQLRDLNYRIVERLRMLLDVKAHVVMMDFQIGERVVFHSEEGESVFGTLTRHKRKSVSVLDEDGTHWRVSPGLLRRAEVVERSMTYVAPGTSPKPEGAQLSLIKG